jgi:trimethylamine--corrinoid protein Co-methyltransferase
MIKLDVLNQNEIERIHNTTIELLEHVGIKIESKEALDLFEKNGATVDKKAKFVYIPEFLIKRSLMKVPKSFSLFGPDGSHKVDVSISSSAFATMGAAVNIYDPSRKKLIRKTNLKDGIDHIRVVNELEHINCSHVDVWPHDIPFTEIHYHTIYNWAKFSYKPYGMSCYGRIASQDMMNMLSIIVDGEENLRNEPRLIGIFNPLSPLTLPQLLVNGLFIFANYNQPLLISAAASAGSTSPVTLAGTLVQANMEVLSSIVLTQLINPGTPVLYGSTNTILDPLSGNVAYGSIEFSIITIASAQLAHFYKIPSKGSGSLTDSKCFDIQNGFERFFTLYTAMAAGHNYITCAGTYESLLSETLELLVIDNELINILKGILQKGEFDEKVLIVKQLKSDNAKNKNSMRLKEKVKNIKNEIFNKEIFKSIINTIWKTEGDKTIMNKAKDLVYQILKMVKESGLSEAVDKELKSYYKIIASRSLEDYKKLEGMEGTTNNVNIGGIDVN